MEHKDKNPVSMHDAQTSGFKQNENENSESDEKPPMSIVQLVAEALNNAPENILAMSDIFKAVSDRYPYYKKLKDKGWQETVRRVLSEGKNFIIEKKSKRYYWKISDANSIPKGQLNSGWIYEVIVSPKTPTKNYRDFCPASLLEGRAEISVIFGWDFGRKNDLINSFWI